MNTEHQHCCNVLTSECLDMAASVGEALITAAFVAIEAEKRGHFAKADAAAEDVWEASASFATMSDDEVRCAMDGIVGFIKRQHSDRLSNRTPRHSEPEREGMRDCADGPSSRAPGVPTPVRWYREGQKYNRLVFDAVRTLQEGDATAAARLADAADKLLWPLGTLDDPEDLRDFIAGAANAAESYLWERRDHGQLVLSGPLLP